MGTPAAYFPACELSLAELINQFLVAKAALGRSDRYLRQLRSSLAGFAKGRARRLAAEVSTDDLESWAASLDVAPRTVRGYVADWRTVFAWAVRRGWLQDNPAARVECPALASEREIAIHTPDQVRQVLAWAFSRNPDVGRHLAVRYFAGVRSAEAHRMREDAIQADRGVIEVSAARSKTRSRRLVTIQPALTAWLSLGGVLRGISPNTIKAALRGCPVPMAHNVTRHSFVSYHLAGFGSAGRTAIEAGHSEAMLFRHYRALVTESAAAAFWSLRPIVSLGPPENDQD